MHVLDWYPFFKFQFRQMVVLGTSLLVPLYVDRNPGGHRFKWEAVDVTQMCVYPISLYLLTTCIVYWKIAMNVEFVYKWFKSFFEEIFSPHLFLHFIFVAHKFCGAFAECRFMTSCFGIFGITVQLNFNFLKWRNCLALILRILLSGKEQSVVR